jgi:hypothetical protein
MGGWEPLKSAELRERIDVGRWAILLEEVDLWSQIEVTTGHKSKNETRSS